MQGSELIFQFQSFIGWIWLIIKPQLGWMGPIGAFLLGEWKERRSQNYQEQRWYKQHILEQKTLAFHELALYLSELHTFLRTIPETMYEERYPDWENRAFQTRLNYLRGLAHCGIYLKADLKRELLRPLYIFEEALDIVIERMQGRIRTEGLDKATQERRETFFQSYQQAVKLLESLTENDKIIIQEILKTG